MSGLSFTPLSVALGIKPGTKVSLINPPPGFASRLNPLPEGVEFLVTARTGLDVILFSPRTWWSWWTGSPHWPAPWP
jgi:hypothetical protein